jgi:hypothetical protein
LHRGQRQENILTINLLFSTLVFAIAAKLYLIPKPVRQRPLLTMTASPRRTAYWAIPRLAGEGATPRKPFCASPLAAAGTPAACLQCSHGRANFDVVRPARGQSSASGAVER